MKLASRLAAVFFLWVIATQVDAGLVVKQKTVDSDTNKIEQATLYIEGNRMAVRSDAGTGMIFDGDRQISWNYDLKRKMYMKLSAAQAKAMIEKSKAYADKMMKAQMKQMSPKMRKQFEAEMKKQQQGPTYKKMGAVRKVGQWHCVPVAKFSPEGQQQDSLCIASFRELGIDHKDRKIFKSLGRFMSTMGGGNCDDCSNSGVLPERLQKQLGLNGLPIEERNGGSEVTTILSIKHESVPAGVFKLPSGLREQKLPGM